MTDPKPLVGHARTRANLCAGGDHPLRETDGHYHTDVAGDGYCCRCAALRKDCRDVEPLGPRPKIEPEPTTHYGTCSVCGELLVFDEVLARVTMTRRGRLVGGYLVHERHLKIEA